VDVVDKLWKNVMYIAVNITKLWLSKEDSQSDKNESVKSMYGASKSMYLFGL